MAFGESAARDPQTRPEKLTRLSRRENPTIRKLVALNASTPSATLSVLATDSDPEVVLAAAKNLLTPAAVLEKLAHSSNAAIRVAVAANPAATASILAAIAKARSCTDREKIGVASNPSASAGTLSELGMSRHFTSSEVEHQVLVAVASNPSSSVGTLRHLFQPTEKSPLHRTINRAIAGNPATPLDTRVHLFGMDVYRALVLASEPREASESRIRSARAASSREADLLAQSRYPEVRRAVALAPGVTDATLEELLDDTILEVALVARARSATDQTQLAEYVASTDIMVLEALIRNQSLSRELKVAAMKACLTSADDDTLEIIAKDPTTPSSILGEVVAMAEGSTQTAATRLKRAVAMNSGVSAEALQKLAIDANAQIRTLAGSSSTIPLNSLVKLAVDADHKVREAVAKNLATPAELLLRLATDETPAVVEAVACNPNATSVVLDRVVSDQLERRKHLQPKSRYSSELPEFPLGPLTATATNPRTSQDSLRVLADSVEQALDSAPSHSRNETIVGREVRVWKGIAGNPSAPAAVLDRVARAVHKEVWTKVDPDRGGRELEDLRDSTLRKLMKNPSASMETLEFLSSGDWVARKTTRRRERDDGRTLSWTVWDHISTAAAKQDLASMVREEILFRQWNSASGREDRLAFADNPDAPAEILDKLSSDADLAVRCAVASNPSTEPSVFKRLAEDPEVSVRLAAAAATHPGPASSKQGSYSYSKDSRESRFGVAFDILARDEDAIVRATVAENHEVFWGALSQDFRDKLVFDDDYRVRGAVLGAIDGRKDTIGDDFGLSADALFYLIETSGPVVWRNLAEKGSLQFSVDVLNRLLDTGDTATALCVVDAYHVDLPLLVRLAASEDAAVVEAVASRSYYGAHDWSVDESLISALLRSTLTPGVYLESIVSNRFVERRIEAAIKADDGADTARPSLSIEAIVARARAKVEVQAEIRKKIEQDETFLHRAISHSNFPEASLIAYAEGADVRLIRAVVRTSNVRALVAAASNLASPPEILERLMVSTEPDVRRALLENKNTSPEAVVRLIQSGVD